MIDILNIRNIDNEEMNQTYKIVKEKEQLIQKTEMMMQETSIYSDAYKPLFIYEMDENSLKEFSKQLNQKLRHVKLAISKANLGQNKYKNEADEQHNPNSAQSIQKANSVQKNRLDSSMFNKSIRYFGYDKHAKELIKEYEINLQKLRSAKAKVEDKISSNQFKSDYKKKHPDTGIEALVKKTNTLKESIDNHFSQEHFIPSSAISSKLPQIRNEKQMVAKKIQEVLPNRKASTINYHTIKSKYKPKDKMSVAEVFDSYQDEYKDFLNSLINPMSKLSKLTKKDGTYLNKILTSDLAEDFQNFQSYERQAGSKHSEEGSLVEFKKN